jgi:hypothetical protein
MLHARAPPPGLCLTRGGAQEPCTFAIAILLVHVVFSKLSARFSRGFLLRDGTGHVIAWKQ